MPAQGMSLGISMRILVALTVGIAAALPAHAQSLRDAVEAAWMRQPLAQARAARESEYAARREAANALTPEPPAIAFGHLTDQVNRNEGRREWEAEFSLPLWLPGQKGRQTAVVDAERSHFDTAVAAARLRVAGEVRDSYWQARLAESELALARRKVEAAATLAGDVARRVIAGDLARVDLNQAQAAGHSARAALAEAESKAFRARQAFATLTGMVALPSAGERPRAQPSLESHPELLALQRAVAAAQARLTQAALDRRDNPELALAMTRERDAFDQPFDNTLSLRLRLPFATGARNQPRIAGANAQMIEAQAAYRLERNKLAAEIDAARRELAQTEAVRQFAETRFILLAEAHRLLARAFSLGELDFVSRLRAENERFEAESNRDRAALEASRAASRLNQAQGLLP